MKVKRYTVTEAQRDFERLLLEAKQGVEVYIVDEGKQVVQLVPFERDKERIFGDQQQI